MARETKTPGQIEDPNLDDVQEETQQEEQAQETNAVLDVSVEQLERIEASLASLHAKLDSFLKLANMTCMVVDDQTPKRWVHDPKLGHVLK